MTTQERQIMKRLIPDLLPMNHVSLTTKRIRFIQGQGALVYNDRYAVEIYLPRGNESAVFFGVHRHHGKIADLKRDFRKLRVLHIDEPNVSTLMKNQFDEAMFQYEPINWSGDQWIKPVATSNDNVIEAKDLFLQGKLSGAA